MIPALVALPTTVFDQGDLDDLVACVRLLGEGRTVLVGPQRRADGAILDEFVIAAAIAARDVSAVVGVSARVCSGRAASVVAREATAAQLLGACDVLLLEGTPARCADAAVVIAALLTPGHHTVEAGEEHVVNAPNLPQPSTPGAPMVLWADGAAVHAGAGEDPLALGVRTALRAPGPLPAAVPGTLVTLDAPLLTPRALAALLSP